MERRIAETETDDTEASTGGIGVETCMIRVGELHPREIGVEVARGLGAGVVVVVEVGVGVQVGAGELDIKIVEVQ